MSDFNYAYIFIILAVAYALQLLLTGWQAKRFFRRLKVLRKDGTLSIGLSGGKWSGRTYAVLVVDKEMNIIHAGKLSGMTIFSQLKFVDGLVGLNARELLDQTKDFPIKKKLLAAFHNAAKEFFNEDGKPIADLKQLDALP
jgi:glucitol operon activator protein